METLSLQMMSRVVWWLRLCFKVGEKGWFVLGKSEVAGGDECKEKERFQAKTRSMVQWPWDNKDR